MKTLLLSLLLVLPTFAQNFEDPGSHLVGWQDVSFTDPGGLAISGRVYYPAMSAGQNTTSDPSGGPFPLVGLIHGAGQAVENYGLFSEHVASWGFVVAAVRGADIPAELAGRMSSLLEWSEAESSNATSFLMGMVSATPWSCMGHSMGGRTLLHLIHQEPRVRVVLGFEALFNRAVIPATVLASVAAFTGSVGSISGSEDPIVPPAASLEWYRAASSAQRKTLQEQIGGGHFGPLDAPQHLGEALTLAEQHRIHRKLSVAFLLSEAKGQEDLWSALLGDLGVGEPINRRANLVEPVLWQAPSSSTANHHALGLAGRALDLGIIAVSPNPANLSTGFGTLGLDPGSLIILAQNFPLGGAASLETLVSTAGLSGQTYYAQGLVLRSPGGVLTRTAAVSFP